MRRAKQPAKTTCLRTMILLAGLYLAMLSLPVKAQMPCKIEHYSTEDGLSHDIIACMFKDSEGYMWFGTWYGLNRFDGQHFTSYKAEVGDSARLRNNRIDQIKEDKYQQLWVKAYDGQIYRFNKATERFRSLADILNLKTQILFNNILSADDGSLWLSTLGYGIICVPDIKAHPSAYVWYKKDAPGELSLPSNKDLFFYKDTRKNVWIGTDKGLVFFEHKPDGSYKAHKQEQMGYNVSFSGMAASPTGLFFGTADGNLIICNSGGKMVKSIHVSNGQVNQLKVSRDQSKLFFSTSAGELGILNIRTEALRLFNYPGKSALHSLFEDIRGDIWIGPDSKGVIRFDTNKYKFYTYTQKNSPAYAIGGDHFKIFEDVNKNVWCVLKDGGFGYYDPKKENFEYFYNEPGSKDRRLSNYVTMVFYDPMGLMWIHTNEHGLEKVIFQPPVFERHLIDEQELFLANNEVRGICTDSKDRLWICTKKGGVTVVANGQKVNVNFTTDQGAVHIGAIYSIIEDKKGVIWMGTKADGLYKAIPIDAARNNYHLIHFLNDPNDLLSIGSNMIYSIAQDDKGRVWIGSFDNGLYLAEDNGGKTSFLPINSATQGYPFGFEKIRSIATDGKGQLWLGTTQGLVIINTNRQKFSFSTYTKEPGARHSLGYNDVQFIHRDKSGNMWLATSGGGLNKAVVNNTTGAVSFVAYTTKQGLASDYILSCTEDNAGHLWLATKSSLSRFDLRTQKIKNFTSYDGLPETGFSESTCLRTRDGKMVFGTLSGYLIFDPLQIKAYPINANLVLTNLQVNNSDVAAADSTGILSANINYTKAITLRYNQNVFSVEYALLDYRFESNLPFAYRLKGFDNTWHDNKNKLQVGYTNLPAGSYQLELKCADPELYPNLPFKSLSITVLPAPWFSWWAYLIYGIVIAAIIAIIWRTTLTSLKLKHKMVVEQQLTELKLNFFTNLSHELRTPLTLIINPIEQLAQQEQLTFRGREYITIVQRNANRMIRFVNQLLDFRKLQHGKAKLNLSGVELLAFVQAIAKHFDDMAREKEIDLTISCSAKELFVSIDQEKIETVIYNLLSNAFKFSPVQGHIIISINVDRAVDLITIAVKDEGTGVPADDLSIIFELYQAKPSPEAQNLKGTGIGLALSKDLVELHGGTISAENVQSGFTVKFTLPFIEAGQTASSLFVAEQVGGHAEPLVSDEVSNQPGLPSIGAPLLLLVEDNKDMREFLRTQLNDIYRVEVAVNGSEGLKRVKDLLPDIVLSDVMMPLMDGMEMIKHLKDDIATSHIPVILMSARGAVEHQIAGLNCGADYYLPKPFQNELLLAAIANIVQRRKKLIEHLSSGKNTVTLTPGEIIVAPKDEIFLKKIIDIIDEKMTEPDFDIETVSESINMSRATFYKKFKSLTQIAPVEFVRDMRLERAKQYLDAGTGNVTEIAYQVGFTSPKYFSTCFRAKFNLSPSEYQKSLKVHNIDHAE